MSYEILSISIPIAVDAVSSEVKQGILCSVAARLIWNPSLIISSLPPSIVLITAWTVPLRIISTTFGCPASNFVTRFTGMFNPSMSADVPSVA